MFGSAIARHIDMKLLTFKSLPEATAFFKMQDPAKKWLKKYMVAIPLHKRKYEFVCYASIVYRIALRFKMRKLKRKLIPL